MSRLTPQRRTLLKLAVVAAMCLAAGLLSSNPVVATVSGLPLVLFLPGAATVSAIDPHYLQLHGAQRVLWSVGASIGLIIAGGLLLNLTGGLTRIHWMILVTTVIVIGILIAWIRSEASSEQDGVPGSLPSRAHAAITLRQGLLISAAIATVFVAIGISVRTDASANREHFLQAWILPYPQSDKWSTTVHVGLTNYEGVSERLVVSESVGTPSSSSQQKITLGVGRSWRLTISRKPGEPVTVTVGLASQPKQAILSVNLARPTSI